MRVSVVDVTQPASKDSLCRITSRGVDTAFTLTVSRREGEPPFVPGQSRLGHSAPADSRCRPSTYGSAT